MRPSCTGSTELAISISLRAATSGLAKGRGSTNVLNLVLPEEDGVSASILEGLDQMLTVIRMGLPPELRRSLGCTNAIESLMAVLRQVCRNVKRWRDARMALRWTGTAMLEAKKTFRRLKAHKQLPVLRAALLRHQQTLIGEQAIARKNLAA